MIMNKAQADALCAIIALGFVGQNEMNKENNSPYIYDNNADHGNHQILTGILRDSYNINITANLQNAAVPGSIKIHPFIYALPYGNAGEPRELLLTVVKEEEIDALDIANAIELEVNAQINPGNPYRGAYIGGFINFVTREITLLGPSSLYLRERVYLVPNNPTPADVFNTLSNFNYVTSAVKRFFIQNGGRLNIFGPRYNNVIIAPDITESLIFEVNPGDDALIYDNHMIPASCHGLITSMYYHSDVSPGHLNDGACIELSLSKDTCKSASCMPCAIFATAQGAPPSAIHFGRGDYWNLPRIDIRESLNPKLEDNWRSFVIDCFKAASNDVIQRKTTINPVTLQMANLSMNNDEIVAIPEMFLDALAFEGSFIDKMINSL